MTKPQLQPGLPGRQDVCPCGSQKKYKNCCGRPKPGLSKSAKAQQERTDRFVVACQAAIQAFEAGNLSQAQAHCVQALQLNPQHAELLYLSAMIAVRQNEYTSALEYIQRALEQVPQSSMFYNALGLIQLGLELPEEAEKAYRTALQLDPANALAYHNLGDLFYERQDTTTAEQCYREALRYKPDFPEAHSSMGFLRLHQYQFDPAILHFARAIELDPNLFNVYHGLARALREQNRLPQAQAVLEQVIRLKPDFAEAWHDLGLTLSALNKPAEALTALKKSAELKPDLDLAYLNIGSRYYELGLVDVARQHFQRALAARPSDGTRVRTALCFPAFYDSVAQLNEEYERLTIELEQLSAAPLQINNPLEEVAITPFYLAYRGENEVGILSRFGDLFQRACPSLNFIAPHCLASKRRVGRLKIGFLSSSFSRSSHIVNRVMGPVIANWPRDSFEVTLFYHLAPGGEIVQYLRDGDRLIALPQALDGARQQIAEQELDILFYCDLGMEPWSYFLSFARLAPVQLTVGGHPITSGVANVDYFLSSAIDEVAHAQQHYRERVLLLPQRSVCYTPATPPALSKTRADFGLPENKRLYLCPMTPFKLHPAMDQLFGEILRTDSEGEVLLVVNHQTVLWERLKQRFARTIPDVSARIRFLPPFSLPNFVELLRLSDVMLDTTKFNGGTTSLEALAVGTPIVTWPGEFLRQRCTYAMYNAMDWRECVVEDAPHYVRLATEIARRPEYREHLKQEILARNQALFGQTGWIKPFSDFMVETVENSFARTS